MPAGNIPLSTNDFGTGTRAANEPMAEGPQARKLAAIPEATFLEGLSVLLGDNNQLLIVGDFKTQLIFSVEAETGEYFVVINNTYTAPGTTYGFGTAGTDGLKVRGDTLYFGNAGQDALVRVPLNASDGTPVGNFETLATKLTSYDQWDDFTLGCKGDIFIATGGANTVQRIDRDGEVAIVAGSLDSTAIAEPTAAAFGRRQGDDEGVLYVTTGGGSGAPVNGDLIMGGRTGPDSQD